jgi:hypothetical protein
MTPDEKLKIVTALRSGEYKQARKTLCGYDGSLCCIGVAYVALGHNSTVDVQNIEDATDDETEYAAVQSGLEPYMTQLVKLNDEEEQNFDYIADWIDANVRTT